MGCLLSTLAVASLSILVGDDIFDVNSPIDGISLKIYDYTLTFNMEKSLMWNAPWSVAKVLFLLTRYVVFSDITIVVWREYVYLTPGQIEYKLLFVDQLKPNATNADCSWSYQSTGCKLYSTLEDGGLMGSNSLLTSQG